MKKVKSLKNSNQIKENLAFKSLTISIILAGVFLVVSLFLNGGVITLFMNKGFIWEVIDVSIKVSSILLCFLFFLISIGNYKDLTGKPVDWKELLLLFSLSLVQTFRSLWVFLITLIGLLVLLFYLYLTQES